MRKKVLITGGFGFIGIEVCAQFSHWNAHVWDTKTGDNLFRNDTLDEDYDAIVHLVAQLEILGANPKTELVMNVESTIHMLELARKYDIPKFVFTSTADVYGEPQIVASREVDALNPFWTYAASKVAAEAYVRTYEELYGIKTVIIRPSIVTGIGEWYGRFVTLSMARIRKKQPILVFGNGKQSRDFVAVRDVARLIYMVTAKDIKTPEVFNASSGESRTIYDVAHMILDSCRELKIGYPYPCIKWMDPKVGELGRKPHEQIRQHLDNCHASFVLGWEPKEDFTKLLTQELEWVMKMSNEEFAKWTKNPRY